MSVGSFTVYQNLSITNSLLVCRAENSLTTCPSYPTLPYATKIIGTIYNHLL